MRNRGYWWICRRIDDVDEQTGAENPVTAIRNSLTPYGPNVDGFFPKAFVKILGANIFP
jgi:hypothetical protein